jgi:hypothetical protein
MRVRVFYFLLCPALLFLLGAMCLAEEDDFKPLFNGKDLSGWVRVNTAPSTWTIEDGMIVCSGKPIGELRTERMYQNFILELEWRHMKPRGNAGVFVWADDITAKGVPFHRSIEVQVLENDYGNTESHTTHGDIFPIHGATMTPINGRGNGSRAFPTEFRSKPSPEWNHYRIECNDGNISLAVNGKVVTQGKDASPRKGYICLESEGGIVHYRNIKLKELPDTKIDEKHVAIADRGYRSIYTGLDLSGWKAEGEGWESQDWILAHVGEKEGTLSTTDGFDRIGFLFDVRLTKESETATVTIRELKISIDPKDSRIGKHLNPVGQWNRIEGTLRGPMCTLKVNGQDVTDRRDAEKSRDYTWQLRAEGPVQFANLYVRELKE